jgi:SET domain
MYEQFLEVRPSTNGLGVFTKVEIPSKVPIIEITGELYKSDNLPDHPAIIQIGPNTFVGPSGKPDDHLNHSCNPNCKLLIAGNRAILYSLYVIPINNELTFDYSTTSTDTLEEWSMKCNCDHNRCRQVISGHHYLDQQTKMDYTKRGMLPLYILYPDMFPRI